MLSTCFACTDLIWGLARQGSLIRAIADSSLRSGPDDVAKARFSLEGEVEDYGRDFPKPINISKPRVFFNMR